jgi:serpin B
MGSHRLLRIGVASSVCIALGVSAALLLSGCGERQVTSSSVKSTSPAAQVSAPSTLPARLRVTKAGEADAAEAASSNNAFALDFFRTVRSPSENLVCSPYSLSLALAMTMAGARGATQAEIKQTLHLSLQYYRLHAAMNALDQNLAVEGSFKSANSIWGQTGRDFKQPFVDVVAHYYGAALRLLDMDKDYAGACDTINDWVSQETDGRITGLMSPADKPDTPLLMMLVNAVHFKADWNRPFWPAATQLRPFYLVGGTKADVPMMWQTADFHYLKTEDLQVIELPYSAQPFSETGGPFSMVVLMPAEGRFEAFAGQADGKTIAADLDRLERGKVDLRLPSFEITSTPKVKEALLAMGMTTAFTASADLTGIADPLPGWPGWYITDVRQKAFISTNERGTEAAATTGVTTAAAGSTTTTVPPVEMTIDHPFVYMIRDMQSGAILFIGQVVDPSKT